MELTTAISLFRSNCDEMGIPCLDPLRHVIDRRGYWFFAYPEPLIGRTGLIIRKRDALITVLGSGFGIQREVGFWAYELGLLTGRCDLVITGFAGKADEVIDILTKTPPSQRGMNIPGRGREKWYAALANLPVVIFADVDLCNYVDELWEAHRRGTFSFEIRPT